MLKNLIFPTLGIYIAYLYHSVISQKLYGGYEYPRKNQSGADLFLHPSLVFALASLMCSIFGFIKGRIMKEPVNPISFKQKLILGVLYTSNYLTAHYCLLFITYPTQSIGRNLRYLTVILVGILCSRVPKTTTEQKKIAIGIELFFNQGKNKILIGILITIGVIIFNVMKFINEQIDIHESDQAWIGYLLLIVSVFCDAFFNDNQAYTKITYKPTSNHLYTCTNIFGFVFVVIFSTLKGTLIPSIQFIITHNQVLYDILIMIILQLIGQNCIYYIVSNFKQHIFPLIATTRKLLTVLISIYIYNHPINIYQWLAVFLVFGAMIYQIKEQNKNEKEIQLQKNLINSQIQKKQKQKIT